MRTRWRKDYEVNCNLEFQAEKFNRVQDITYQYREDVTSSKSVQGRSDMKTNGNRQPNRVKIIAIIGGGCTGLSAVIAVKEEGMIPVCFEKTGNPGGTWCYRDETYEGVASTMPSTIINHSKEIGAYSTFPPAREYNNYMRHAEVYRYFSEYWAAHDCLRYVHVNMETVGVRRAEDYDVTGRWVVNVRSTVTGEVFCDVFDGVMVAVGHINRPKMPEYPGQEKFRGKVVHTHSLKGVDEFKRQNVVVVGIGCSALDAAVEASNVAKQVYLSTKSGAYIMTRLGPKGYPMDYILLRRYLSNLLRWLPRDWCSFYIEKKYLEPRFSPKLYHVKPKYHMLQKDPIINDHIGSKLLSGSVVQKKDISHFTETGVVFEGDDFVTEADTVIMATGYTWKFPFLEDGIIVKEGEMFKLFKGMYPFHLKHTSLVIMGFLLPWGPGLPISEMQSRWAAQIFAGKRKLPSVEEMNRDIRRRYQYNRKWYAPNDKIAIRVDYVQYMDELAELLGVKPNLLKLFFTDTKLFWKLHFGPCLSYQYRLRGPHKWEGAREAIMTSKERMLYPLQRPSAKDNNAQAHLNLAYCKEFE